MVTGFTNFIQYAVKAEVGDKILSSLDKDIHNNLLAFFT